jgi:hypothetical protein
MVDQPTLPVPFPQPRQAKIIPLCEKSKIDKTKEKKVACAKGEANEVLCCDKSCSKGVAVEMRRKISVGAERVVLCRPRRGLAAEERVAVGAGL